MVLRLVALCLVDEVLMTSSMLVSFGAADDLYVVPLKCFHRLTSVASLGFGWLGFGLLVGPRISA